MSKNYFAQFARCAYNAHTMSALSNVLDDFLRETGHNQTAFAAEHDLDRGTLNRAVRGSISIGPDAASRIIRALPQNWQGRAVAGWLADQAPADLRNLVEITAATGRLQEVQPSRELPAGLSKTLREAIIWLAEQALIHVEISDLVMNLFRTLSRPASPLAPALAAFSVRRGGVSKLTKSERIERALNKLREQAMKDNTTLEVLEDQIAQDFPEE